MTLVDNDSLNYFDQSMKQSADTEDFSALNAAIDVCDNLIETNNNPKKRSLDDHIDDEMLEEADTSMIINQPRSKKNRQSNDSDIEIITIGSDDDDDNNATTAKPEYKPNASSLNKSSYEMKKYDSDPDIIELSDTEIDYKPKIRSTLFIPMTGSLTLSKTASAGGQQVLAKVEKVEKFEKLEKLEKLEKTEYEDADDDIIIEYDVPSVSNQAYLLESNPSQLDKKALTAQVAQGLTRRQTSKNACFEDQIRSLINPIFKSMESKPEPDRNFDNFVSHKVIYLYI